MMSRIAKALCVGLAGLGCGAALGGFSSPQGDAAGFGGAEGSGSGFGAAQGSATVAAVSTNDQLIPDATESTTIYYVSDSSGDDANDGLSPENALKTVSAGLAKLTTTPKDQRLLFKRGDVWTDQAWGRVKARGLSAAAPCVYGAYGAGSERPRFDIQASTGAFYCQGGGGTPAVVSDVAFQDLHFYAYTRDPSNPSYSANNGGIGFYWLQGIDGFVFERCTFDYFATGVSLEDLSGNGWANTMVFNECTFSNSYNASAHSQGFYCSTYSAADPDPKTTLTFRRCVFYRNGWNPDVPVAETIYNHHIYAQNSDYWATQAVPILVEDCIFLYGSSHGIQARSGGTVRRSLFVRNAISVLIGGGTSPVTGGVEGAVTDNVILEGDDIAGSARAIGIDLDNLKSGGTTTVSGNKLANAINPSSSASYALDTDGEATYGSGNVSHNWVTGSAASEYLTDTSETYTRSLATYDSAQGGPGTEANCIAKILQRDPSYLVDDLLTYFRAGF